MTNEGAPAGGRKYFLVPPDTFELLVENFDAVQRMKKDPGIKLALDLEKKVKHRKSTAADQDEAKNGIEVLLKEHRSSMRQLYEEAMEVHGNVKEKPVKERIVEYSSDSDDSTALKQRKRKWVSFKE